MVEKPDLRNEGEETLEDQQPTILPNSEEARSETEEIDASFHVIQDTLGRLIRQEMLVVRQELRSELHIGPLPHEKTLEAYERIVPGSARMIFTNFEEQGTHRRQLERYALVSGTYRSFAGLACGLTVTLSFLVIGYLLIKGGHGWEGTVLGTVDLVGLVAVFVYGNRVLRAERIERSKIMAGQEDGKDKADGA